MKKALFLLFVCLIVWSCKTITLVSDSEPESVAPNVELRGVWIATVANIDWPLKGTTNIEELKQRFTEILDFYQELQFNAVFVQVRTAGDALYESKFAPWSRFLTGQEGRALDEDLLPWMISAAHERGMEFHAWLNPFRATTTLETNILSESHAYFQHRDWILKYGKKYYFNPGHPEVPQHVYQVINELVNKYKIDGIHFDDYFYPYKIKDEELDDSLTYFSRANKSLSLPDWRRDNISKFIVGCQQLIDSINPSVQFGVSPFGVWRNQDKDASGSKTRAGQTTYDDLYADTRLWTQKNYVDYIAPQAYWSMDYKAASHRLLVDWWSQEANNLPLYMGLGAYKVQNNHDTAWNDLRELPTQIAYSRQTDVVDGFIVFSAKSMMANQALTELLKKETFNLPAITQQQYRWTESAEFKNLSYTWEKNNLTFCDTNNEIKSIEIEYTKNRSLFGDKKFTHKKDLKNDCVSQKIPKSVSNLFYRIENNAGILSKRIQIKR